MKTWDLLNSKALSHVPSICLWVKRWACSQKTRTHGGCQLEDKAMVSGKNGRLTLWALTRRAAPSQPHMDIPWHPTDMSFPIVGWKQFHSVEERSWGCQGPLVWGACLRGGHHQRCSVITGDKRNSELAETVVKSYPQSDTLTFHSYWWVGWPVQGHWDWGVAELARKLVKTWDWISGSYGELFGGFGFKDVPQSSRGFGLGMHKETSLELTNVSVMVLGGWSEGSPGSLSQPLQWQLTSSWRPCSSVFRVYPRELAGSSFPTSLCSAVVPAAAGTGTRSRWLVRANHFISGTL